MPRTRINNSKKKHNKMKIINNSFINNISRRVKSCFTRRSRKTKIKNIKYPSITYFNIDSHFVYDFG